MAAARPCKSCGIVRTRSSTGRCQRCRLLRAGNYPRKLASGFIARSREDVIFDQVVCASFDELGRPYRVKWP